MLFERQVLTHDFLTREMWPLLERHYKEVAVDQDIPLKPDFETYLSMEQAGFIRCFVARETTADNTLALVGYAVYFVKNNIHYSTSLQAVQDVLFIDKSSRGTGMRFINWCDGELRKEGVQRVIQHVKTFLNFGPLLERLGYLHIENIYARRLD
jgi:hypothetical protein